MAYIGDRLEVFAGTTPDRTALACGPVRLSWLDLIETIGVAETQIRRRTSFGARIALLLKNPAELIICFVACARSGRIAVVLDPEWPEARKQATLDTISAGLLIDDARFSAFKSSAVTAPVDAGVAEDPAPGEDDLFYAGFTSGTSGTPKGYVRTHGSWLESFALSEREFGASGANRVVLAGQLNHSLHLYGAVCGLACGQEVVLLPRFDPRAVLAELEGASDGAVLYATPTQLHYLAEAARRSGPVVAVAQVFSSGAKWGGEDRNALARVFPKAQLIEFYGASEASFITVARPDESIPEGSVGRAASGVDILIGNPDTPAPSGEPGPVWVRSAMLFSGYICGASPLTRWQDGWLTFGDHGYLDADGFLFLTGRENRMIVTSGLNVYPEEIEAALCAHPAVAVAVVVGLSDRARGERLEAAVQLSSDLPEAEAFLQKHCKALLGTGKVPRRIKVVDRLPLTAGGKPDIQRITSDLSKEACKEGM